MGKYYSKLSKELIFQEYVKNQLTIDQIAEKYDYSQSHVFKTIKAYGLNKDFDLLCVNKRFGKLEVMQRHNTTGQREYTCLCDCGNQVVVKANNLLTGNTKSCGCSHQRRKQDNPKFKGYKEIYGSYWLKCRKNAEARNLEFNITIEYAWKLYEKQNRQCALSGMVIQFAHTSGVTTSQTASLDRIDSKVGYFVGNVQWVHKKIQSIKMDLDEDDFIYWCMLIAYHKGLSGYFSGPPMIKF